VAKVVRELVLIARSGIARIVRHRPEDGAPKYAIEYDTMAGKVKSTPITMTEKDVSTYTSPTRGGYRYPTVEEAAAWTADQRAAR
jgi:hypothetical protein